MAELNVPPDSLSADAIRARLVALGTGRAADAPRIVVIDECASTNDLALERLRAGDVGRFVITADVQHAGRGRRGATWRTLPGEALAFSMGRTFSRPLTALGGLSLAIGASVAQSLHALGGRDVRVKWPNDLLVGTAKLGGILVETVQVEGRVRAAIGIGLNVRAPKSLSSELSRPVADLNRAIQQCPSRNELLARIVADLEPALDGFDREGFEFARQSWLALHAWHGRRVHVLLPDGTTIEGEAREVALDGALVIITTHGPRSVHTGDISLVTQ